MLRWEAQPQGSLYAYSGDLVVGLVYQLSGEEGPEHQWYWVFSLTPQNYIVKGRGHSKTQARAKTSLSNIYHEWCTFAGLFGIREKERFQRKIERLRLERDTAQRDYYDKVAELETEISRLEGESSPRHPA
jgi:hypothetical protein